MSKLNTNSKVFVAKTITQTKKHRKDRLSFERSNVESDKLEDQSELQATCGLFSRNKSSSNRVEELSPSGSDKSYSTMASYQNCIDLGYRSDESDNFCHETNYFGCGLADPNLIPLTFNQVAYNSLEHQKSYVRNNVSEKVSCNSLPTFGNMVSESVYTQASTSPSETSEKKKKRRAGRKHKNHTKQHSDEYPKSDKEKIKYKTEMCKNWVEKGKCSYSVRCRFAHGLQELMKPETEPEIQEYKSKPCISFHQNSYCPYGVRCLFIHEGRSMSEISTSYFSKSLLLTEEAKSVVTFKRLPVFATLSESSD